jgi:hypothetical protein
MQFFRFDYGSEASGSFLMLCSSEWQLYKSSLIQRFGKSATKSKLLVGYFSISGFVALKTVDAWARLHLQISQAPKRFRFLVFVLL